MSGQGKGEWKSRVDSFGGRRNRVVAMNDIRIELEWIGLRGSGCLCMLCRFYLEIVVYAIDRFDR